ncbi:TNF receptor-associated factor 2-like isoform X2 [Glandiceps talaboti]
MVNNKRHLLSQKWGTFLQQLPLTTITRFCRPCLEDGYYSKLDANNMYPDLAISQDLGKCTVSCPNKECSWTGSYKEYHQEHFSGCTSAFRMCDNNGCGKQIRRGKVTEHSYQCDMMFVPCLQCRDYCRQKDLKDYNGKCGQCYRHEHQPESTSADTVVTGNDNRRRMQTAKIDIFKILVLIMSITFMYTFFC